MNEAFRTSRSASLPDCRAYELVTPRELGRTADITFENDVDQAAVSSDGEHLVLVAKVAFLGPGVSLLGTRAVFSRAPAGWMMQSVTAPGMAGEALNMQLLSPDFSQTALEFEKELNSKGRTLDVGPIGGPYSTVASVPLAFSEETRFLGANAGTSGVPAFSNMLLQSEDHALLPLGREREAAEEAKPGRSDLYKWSKGQLRLVNVNNEGKLLNPCGAILGAGRQEGRAINAVSADGSRVFFTSPEAPGLPGCPEPQLYMRVDGKETVDVSEPEGISISPSQRGRVVYDGASPDGSKVFFTTGTNRLYEYSTDAPVGHRLTLIAEEADTVEEELTNPGFVVSEDGSTVYYGAKGAIYRYDAITGTKSFVATPSTPARALEPWYTTPDGGFFVFPSGQPGNPAVQLDGPHGREEELRGVGHDELYRYDAADGSVMCVSCGEGVAPAKGEMLEPQPTNGLYNSPDSSRSAISISEDGRRVFFQTSARLVPQDTNESTAAEEALNLGVGADVYEWEQDGTEEAPGVFCSAVNGCTHLISAGEAIGPERFLGASANGDDVFFTSAAQLVPQATPEFTNIYDARVDGGFPPAPPSVECTSCQGVGSPPPAFNTPATETLVGAGNPAPSEPMPPAKPKPKPKAEHKKQKRKHKKRKMKKMHTFTYVDLLEDPETSRKKQ
jgi:hypothetical protein